MSVLKVIQGMPVQDGKALRAKIGQFADDPYKPYPWAKAFGKGEGRIRHGQWRALYEINQGELRITIVRVGHRKEVYR